MFEMPAQPVRPGANSKCELSPFAHDLIAWGARHHPEAVEAAMGKEHDVDFVRRCLGSIFRRRAKHDPAWLFTSCAEHPKDIIALNPQPGIKWVDLGWIEEWGEIPGRSGWAQYLKDYDLASLIPWATCLSGAELTGVEPVIEQPVSVVKSPQAVEMSLLE